MRPSASLENLLRADLDRFVPLARAAAPLQRFQKDARSALVAALLLGALEIETDLPKLAAAIRKRARRILGAKPSLTNLAVATGLPVGLWYHWLLSTTRAHRDAPPPYWQQVADAHGAVNRYDAISLRRYPMLLPDGAWARIEWPIPPASLSTMRAGC